MLTRCLSVSVASSLHSIPGATCSHSGSDHWRGGGGTGCSAGLLGDAKRQARLQRCRRTQHIGGPGDEPIDHRTQRSRARAGNPGTRRYGLRPRRSRSRAGPAARRRTSARSVGTAVWASGSYPQYVRRELLDWSEMLAASKNKRVPSDRMAVEGTLRAGGARRRRREQVIAVSGASRAPRRFSEGYPWCW